MVIIVMGVAGSGKSTIGNLLAEKLSCSFHDADDFHPPENVAKMSSGQPLNDQDRLPWLQRLHDEIVEWNKTEPHAILACSALKNSYRDILSDGVSDICFVHLKGGYDTIFNRLNQREGHFMSPKMLTSQFEALEDPKDAITVDIDNTPEEIVSQILAHLDKS